MIFLEIYVAGECLRRWSLEDFELTDEGFFDSDLPFCEERSAQLSTLISRFIDTFSLRMEAMLNAIQEYNLFIIVASRDTLFYTALLEPQTQKTEQ